MAIQTTVDIPEPLHNLLSAQSERSGASIRSLIVKALEQTYTTATEVKYVTGPMIHGKGKLGPAFPVDNNPYDLIFP